MIHEIKKYIILAIIVAITLYSYHLRFTYPELTETQLFIKMISGGI